MDMPEARVMPPGQQSSGCPIPVGESVNGSPESKLQGNRSTRSCCSSTPSPDTSWVLPPAPQDGQVQDSDCVRGSRYPTGIEPGGEDRAMEQGSRVVVSMTSFGCKGGEEQKTVYTDPPADLVYGLTMDQVPEFLHHPYIWGGYRFGGTHKQCALSLFRLHNETVNAWTMIFALAISTALFTYAMCAFTLRGAELSAYLGIWLSAVFHNPWSICYHLFTPISVSTYNWWRKADTVLICSNSVLLGYALAYYVCDEPWQLALIMALLFLVCGYSIYKLLALPDGAELDKLAQAIRLAVICIIYWSPMLWETIRELSDGSGERWLTLAMTLVVILSLSSSGVIYAYSLPERFAAPLTFDIVGYSHQVMHVLVIVAHVAEYVFLFHMHNLRRDTFYE